MLESLKNFFKKDKSIEIGLLDVIKQQNEFIAKNIKERVVYVGKDMDYTNTDRFEENDKEEKENEEFDMPEDVGPEELRAIMEKDNNSEGEKSNGNTK